MDAMILDVAELLRLAEAKGMTDKEIAFITGRNYSTIWRWRNRPKKAFICDDGIHKLAKALGQDT